jgi:O-antigen biosynthesis protein
MTSSASAFEPARVIEVELAGPLPTISHDERYPRLRVLGRLHTEPVGACVITVGPDGLTPEQLASALWPELRPAISARFSAAGLEPPDRLPGAGLELDPASWPFLRRRQEALAAAPSVSIVICTRDRPDELARCLASVGQQQYRHYEIVVVDNAPAGEQVRRLVETWRADVPVRYVREPRPGLSWARNAGIAASTGEIIAWLDDDEEADPHWLAGLASGFSLSTDVGCVTGAIVPARLDTSAQELFEQVGGHSNDRGFSSALFARTGPQNPLYPRPPFGAGANMAFRRAALDRIGGFDVSLGAGTPTQAGEDTLAMTLVLLAGYRIAYEPAALVRHHHRRDLDSLGRQLRGYSVGLTAFYAALLRHRPSLLFSLLRLAPLALGYARAPGARRDAPKPELPEGLRGRQRWLILTGPMAYLRSVRRQARVAALAARQA